MRVDVRLKRSQMATANTLQPDIGTKVSTQTKQRTTDEERVHERGTFVVG